MSENWTRTEGVMVATELDPPAVSRHLADAGVVARLEWYPGTEQLVSVSVLCDADHRVATTGPDGLGPGQTLGELADDLAAAFDADVLMEGVHVEGDDSDGAPDWAVVDDHAGTGAVDARTVVLTSMAAHRAPVQANQLHRTVTTAPCTTGGEERRLLMTTGDGPELGVLGWEEDAYPVLRLQVDAEDRTALLLVSPENDEDEGEDVVLFSWSMRSELALGSEAGPAHALAEELLGDGVDAAAFAAAVPGADAAAVAASLRLAGAEGLAAFVAALGLPPAVVDVLEGRAEPASLPDAVVHEPEPAAAPTDVVRPARPAWLTRPAGPAGTRPGKVRPADVRWPGRRSPAPGAEPTGEEPEGATLADTEPVGAEPGDVMPTADAATAEQQLSARAVVQAAKTALEERAAKPLPTLTPGQQKWALRATLAGLGTAAAGAAVIAVIKGATRK